MKKLFSALTAGVMVISMFSAVGVSAETTEKYGKFDFTVLSDDTVRIDSFRGDKNDIEVTIPEVINNHTVSQLGNNVFNKSYYTKSVTIPSTVTKIYSDAFGWKLDDNCNVNVIAVDENNPIYTSYEGNLYSKDMTKLVRYVSDKKDFTIPDTVKTIDSSSLAGLTLNKVVIPDGVETISTDAFYETRINTLSIPVSLKVIENKAFPKTEDYSNGYVGTVKYQGTSAQWNSINIGEDNGLLAPIRSNNPKKPIYVKETTSVKSKAVLLTTDVTNKLSYKSSNTRIATVNSSGRITAKKAGKVTITVKNQKFKNTFTIKVNNPKLSKKTVSVKKNHTVSVKIMGKIKGINNKYTNTKYAKITSKKSASTLKLKGLKKGKTTLKIKVSGVVLKLNVNVC